VVGGVVGVGAERGSLILPYSYSAYNLYVGHTNYY
jgi:hypothetical protein